MPKDTKQQGRSKAKPGPRLVKLRLDVTKMKAEMAEFIRLALSLNRFLQRGRSITKKFCREHFGKRPIRVVRTTLRAGNIIGFAEIRSRDFQRVLAALRALQIDGAHKILSGRSVPGTAGRK